MWAQAPQLLQVASEYVAGQICVGMPVGLQLIAPAGAEERLLAIALAAERVLGTAADRLGTPPLPAS